MRAITLCSVITLIVLLTLSESTGAPTCDGSDKVLSETIKKDASKSSERSAQEEKQATETQSRCSNGLVSGSKSQSESRQLSAKEEEQSHTTAEKKTATGTELVEESVKKKKEVSISEKKTVLVYYLVSYKKLPAQNEGECRIDYYKRVFPKEDNDNVFYRKLFKAYEHEEPKAYIERVEFIFNKVYPEKDCRLDVEWLEHFDHYYTLKYSRKIDESDESYYPRVLQKFKGETKEVYKKRMECLVAALDEEDFTHITFDDSEVGYKIGKRTTPAKSVSSPASSGEQINEVSSTSKKSKEEAEAVVKSESATEQKNKKGTCAANKKKLRKKKTSVEKEEDSKSYAYRVAYDKLPKKCPGEKLETYYKKYFGEYNAKLSSDAIYQLYFRILVQYRGESVSDYVKRIDFLFDNVYPALDLRTNINRICLLEHYYRAKYAKDKQESQEDWFVRVLAKQQGETVEHYKQRVDCMKATITKAKWDQVVIDAASKTGFRLVSGAVNAVKGICGCNKISPKKETCGCNKNSPKKDDASYIKSESSAQSSNSAASSAASTEKEIKSNAASGEFSEKSLSSSTNSAARSTESSSESYEAYHVGRICDDSLLVKKCGESDIDYYKRIFTVDTSCTDSVKSFYTKVFKQYKGETDLEYVKRIDFIFTNVYSKLDIRVNEEYVNYLEKYYKIAYAKKSSESETEYYKRVLKKTTETEEVYTKKVTILKKYITEVNWKKVKIDAKSCTGYTLVESSSEESSSTAKSVETSKSCGCISEEKIKTSYSKKDEEDEKTYFKRIISESSKITSSEEFVKTLTAVRKYYPTLSLWYDSQYVDLVKNYYTAVYTKKTTESVEEQFKRIVAKESFETDQQCAERVAVVHKLFPNLDLWYDEKYYETYTKKVYQSVYKKLTTEDETKYYKRIIAKTTGESDSVYVKRLSLIKQTYSSLDLWYSKDYLKHTSSYYTAKYTKISTEQDETFFKRIVTKETLETDEQCAKRVEIIRELNPNLVLWSDEKYYETYTKVFYQTVYKKITTEDEATYYKRIVTKSSKESDEVYVGRLTLIEKTHKSLALWYDEKYFETVKQFYTLKYAKKSCESEEAYISRIFETKEACDTSTDIFIQRLHLVQLVTVSSSVWYEEKYYEKYTKTYYASYYKKIEKDSCDAWLTKVITLLPGECKENAIKRITLIKKSVSACNCWTEETLSKIEKCFDAAYISEIRKCFFVSESITTSSSSASSSKSATSSSNEDVIVVKRG